jgi:hypothetical protein
MNLVVNRLSLASAQLEILARREADFHAQLLELTDLREQLREARASADLQSAMRARRPAPDPIAEVV